MHIKVDKKTQVFIVAFLTSMFAALYPVGKEVFDALTIYTADPIDWRHILTTHGPAVLAALGAFWQTMKARDMVPDWIPVIDVESTPPPNPPQEK